MEIPNVLGKLRSDKVAPKPFLALAITSELVQAAVWQVVDGATEVVALGTPIEWDGDEKGESGLVQAADATLSAAVEGMTDEPSEIIFGLPDSWTSPDGIAPSRRDLIKAVTRELELKPLGFVVIRDSLLRYLKMQEGTPSTSILIQVGGGELTIHLVRLGRIEATQVVGRSDDIATDVEEGISRFQVPDNLPSRIIVFDGMHNLEDIVQNLVSYDWQSKFNFLHLPKVESLPKDVLIRSVAVAGGAEVAKSMGLDITEPSATEVVAPPPPAPPAPPAAPTTAQPLGDAAEFGFTAAESALISPTPAPPPLPIHSYVSPPTSQPLPPPPQAPVAPPPTPPPRAPRKKFNKSSLPRFPKFKLPSTRFGKRIIFLLLGLIILLGIAGSLIWFVPKATVTLFVAPKSLPETVTLTLSPEVSTVDIASSTVPATMVETTVTGSSTVPTTGSKTIGDTAGGEVVIYNRSDLVKTFPAGTTLTAQGLEFTLDNEVTVASSSSGSDYVDVPGKASVAVTAAAIGTAGNLSENTEFVIEDFSTSTYVARNESSLSGGSSSEIRVVAKEDIANLVETLSTELAAKAKSELLQSSDLGSGIYILEESLEIVDETYSAEVGEETNTLEGELDIMVKGVRYQNIDVEALVNSSIDSAIPEGYVRTDDPPQVDLSSAEEDGEQVTAQAKVEVRLLPKLDDEAVKNTLRGIPATRVEEALSTVVGLDHAQVQISPRFLPPRWKKMPRNPQSISVTILPSN